MLDATRGPFLPRSSKRVSGATSLPVIRAARAASGYVGALKRPPCRSVNGLPEVRPQGLIGKPEAALFSAPSRLRQARRRVMVRQAICALSRLPPTRTPQSPEDRSLYEAVGRHEESQSKINCDKRCQAPCRSGHLLAGDNQVWH